MIDGAKMFIDAGFRIENPAVVQNEIDEYRNENDWLSNFIMECCQVSQEYTQRAGELYETYMEYCGRTHEYARSKADFKAALTDAGYRWQRTKKGAFYYGIETKFVPAPANNPYAKISKGDDR